LAGTPEFGFDSRWRYQFGPLKSGLLLCWDRIGCHFRSVQWNRAARARQADASRWRARADLGGLLDVLIEQVGHVQIERDGIDVIAGSDVSTRALGRQDASSVKTVWPLNRFKKLYDNWTVRNVRYGNVGLLVHHFDMPGFRHRIEAFTACPSAKPAFSFSPSFPVYPYKSDTRRAKYRSSVPLVQLEGAT